MEELAKIQSNLKIILSDFHNLCVEKGLKYSLIGGSLIGAIREKGFIPWDDDADIMMERDEYNKLLKILPNEFEIISIYWIPRLVYKGKTKLYAGNYIDILVFDEASNNKFKHSLKVFFLKFLQGTIKKKEHINLSNYNFLGKVLSVLTYVFGKFFPEKTKLQLYEFIAQLDNNKSTSYLCSYKDQYRYIHIQYDKKIFSSYILVPFEDLMLMSMVGYHEYLSLIFGDYMKLPPEEERIPIHRHLNS